MFSPITYNMAYMILLSCICMQAVSWWYVDIFQLDIKNSKIELYQKHQSEYLWPQYLFCHYMVYYLVFINWTVISNPIWPVNIDHLK